MPRCAVINLLPVYKVISGYHLRINCTSNAQVESVRRYARALLTSKLSMVTNIDSSHFAASAPTMPPCS